MTILLCVVAIMQWILYVYLPISVLYAIMRTIYEQDPLPTICSPFLGLKKVNLQQGFKIWVIQLILAGALLYELAMAWRCGENPLIRIW